MAPRRRDTANVHGTERGPEVTCAPGAEPARIAGVGSRAHASGTRLDHTFGKPAPGTHSGHAETPGGAPGMRSRYASISTARRHLGQRDAPRAGERQACRTRGRANAPMAPPAPPSRSRCHESCTGTPLHRHARATGCAPGHPTFHASELTHAARAVARTRAARASLQRRGGTRWPARVVELRIRGRGGQAARCAAAHREWSAGGPRVLRTRRWSALAPAQGRWPTPHPAWRRRAPVRRRGTARRGATRTRGSDSAPGCRSPHSKSRNTAPRSVGTSSSRPPCASAAAFASARPRPVPPWSRSVV